MSTTPSYLGLLNRISNAETDAACYLDAWAAATPRDDVRKIIATVALREAEHGKAFAKRMCELGYNVEPVEDSKLDERLPITSSTTLTDLEKFQKLGFDKLVDPATPDQFPTMFADSTIDIQTGELLGRYISEERDSTRMFRACYDQLCAEANGGSHTNGASESDRLSRIESMLEQLLARTS